MSNNTFSRWRKSLHLKILAGYVILGLPIPGIITAVWYEKRVFEEAEAEERSLLMQREAAGEAYRGLIALFLDTDRAMLWDDSDMKAYDSRDSHTMEVMDRLKGYYTEPCQTARIDTIVRLLHEKRRLIRHMVELPSTASRMDSLLARRLPELEQTASAQATTVTERTEPEEEKKRGGLLGLFRRKKKEPVRTTTRVSTVPNTRHMAEMQRFEEEMHTALEEQKRAYGRLSDSLEVRNRILNRSLSRLISEIGTEETERMEQRHARVAELRETAFALICGISAAGILCAVLLYAVVRGDIRRRTAEKRQREGLIETLRRSVRENEELTRSRQHLMQTVTHDLRSPLTAIRGNAELILREGGTDTATRHAEHIRQSAERMGALMENLMEYYRIDNGKETARAKPFRLAGIAETLEAEFAPQMAARGLDFEVRNTADEVVTGDRGMILRIGSNLLSNALKFTRRGSVSLTTGYREGRFTITVDDTGTGIEKDRQERIFKPFERLGNAATQDGFGLGLSIVRSLTELMEGSITVDSIPGKGSRFSVVLPLPRPEGTERPDRAAPTAHGGLAGCSVLSIDNDEVMLEMMHDMFEQNGVHCDTCKDMGGLTEKLRGNRYDLLTTDLKMPDMSGYEVLELLRTSDIGNSRTVPVLVATAAGSITREELERAGFDGVLYKPFSTEELLAAAEQCIGENRTRHIDLRPLFAYGNRRRRLESLIRETEKEMNGIREATENDDRERIDGWIHHMRSSWMLIRAEQPLQELYEAIHENHTAEEIREKAGNVLAQGGKIIRLAKKEMEETAWEE